MILFNIPSARLLGAMASLEVKTPKFRHPGEKVAELEAEKADGFSPALIT